MAFKKVLLEGLVTPDDITGSDGSSGQVLTTDGSNSFSWSNNGSSYTLPLASTVARGGVKTGFSSSGKDYAVQLSSEKMYVNVPWTDNNTVDMGDGFTVSATTDTTAITITENEDLFLKAGSGMTVETTGAGEVTFTNSNPTPPQMASNSTSGTIKTGYTQTGKNYPVELDSGKAYVTVPWTDSNELTTEEVQDIVGAMFTSNTAANTAVTYDDTDGTIDVVTTLDGGPLTTEAVQDIVGAMFTSNTETRISATYEDGDGTIDLVVDDMTANDNTQLTTEQVQDIVGDMFSSNTETRISATYQDDDGTIDLVADNMNYTLPTAALGTLGGVKVGTGLGINGSGQLSVSNPLGKDTLETTLALIDTSTTIGSGTGVTMTMSGDLVVTGDLQVSGTEITTNTETILVKDHTMVLNSDLGSGSAVDTGFVFERGSTGDNRTFYWDESASTFVQGLNSSVAIGGTYQCDVTSTEVNASYNSSSTKTPVGHFQWDGSQLYVRTS